MMERIRFHRESAVRQSLRPVREGESTREEGTIRERATGAKVRGICPLGEISRTGSGSSYRKGRGDGDRGLEPCLLCGTQAARAASRKEIMQVPTLYVRQEAIVGF